MAMALAEGHRVNTKQNLLEWAFWLLFFNEKGLFHTFQLAMMKQYSLNILITLWKKNYSVKGNNCCLTDT